MTQDMSIPKNMPSCHDDIYKKIFPLVVRHYVDHVTGHNKAENHDASLSSFWGTNARFGTCKVSQDHYRQLKLAASKDEECANHLLLSNKKEYQDVVHCSYSEVANSCCVFFSRFKAHLIKLNYQWREFEYHFLYFLNVQKLETRIVTDDEDKKRNGGVFPNQSKTC